MVRDRLAEMQSKSTDNKSKKKEANGTPLLNSEQQMEKSLSWVTEIDNKIKSMSDDVEQMKKLQKNIISNPLIDKNEVKKLEQISDKVFNTASKIRKEVDKYRSEIAVMNMDATHERMIRTHVNRLGSNVTTTMNDFRAAQLEYINKTQKLHHRKYEIVAGNEAAGAEPVDLSNVQAVFAGDYFAEAQKAKMELREIETRGIEIKKVEDSVIQVNALFKEINALVMEQGEVIDTIENHIEDAIGDVEAGTSQLSQARRSQAAARKKKFCCCGVLVAILIIVGAIITIGIVSQG